MGLNFELIKKSEYKNSTWSGGITTEMLIYPRSSSYVDRNFTWRISSATVDLDKSEFTSLPDYNRILMILEGKLILKHEGQIPIALHELEQDYFDGNVNTVSEGKVTDYNLMMRKGFCDGSVEVINIDTNLNTTIVLDEKKRPKFNDFTEVYYSIKGTLSISINKNHIMTMEKNDLLVISRKNEKQSIEIELQNINDEEATLIRAKIFY